MLFMLNELMHEDTIMLVDYKTKTGNFAFSLIENCKDDAFLK